MIQGESRYCMMSLYLWLITCLVSVVISFLSLNQYPVHFVSQCRTATYDLLLLAWLPLIKHLMCGKPQLVWRYLGLLGTCGIVNWLTSKLISMWWSSEDHTDLCQCSVLVHPLWSWLKCFELADIRTSIWHTAERNYTLNLYLTQEMWTEVTFVLDFVFCWLLNTLNSWFSSGNKFM